MTCYFLVMFGSQILQNEEKTQGLKNYTDAKLRLDTSLVGKAVMLLIGYVHNSFDDMRSRHLPTSFSDDLMMWAVPILMRFCLAPRYKNHMQKSGHFPKYSQPNLKLD